MSAYAEELRRKVQSLKTYRRGDRRAPHKPLLLLHAISRLRQGSRELPYEEVEESLGQLLKAYAPPVSGRHQPELPYWHLQSDGIWEIPGADDFPRQRGGFPVMAALRSSTGHLTQPFADQLLSDFDLAAEIVGIVLEEHFPPSLHDDILSAVGLELPNQIGVPGRPPPAAIIRDPRFRERVLRAYEHRCAVTGFRAALGGSFFGCEAAHVQWHAYAGPDIVENGIALEPTMHKLFDAGAWSLTDDRRIIVSADFTGTNTALERLRNYHGHKLRKPLLGEKPVGEEFIHWHRDRDKGGVFREPALPLN